MTDHKRSGDEPVLDASLEQVGKVAARVHYPDGSVLYEPLVEHVAVSPDGVRQSSLGRQDIVVDLDAEDEHGKS